MQWKRRFASASRRWLAASLALGLFLPPALAQEGTRRTYIRDAEIEHLLNDYLSPLLRAAGQPQGAVKLALVDDRSFNAFVSSGRRMTLFSGAIVDSVTPNQLIGVLAHETGHISGGHLARLSQELPRAQAIAIIGTLLGAGAVVGASRQGNIGLHGNAPGGLMMSGPELAMRSLLAYQRTEEQAADRAAITFLTATRQSGKGMVETFERMASQQMFLASRIDKYLLSHPLANDRVAAIAEVARQSPYYGAVDPPGLVLRHNLARAKLVAFTGRGEEINRRYPQSDSSLPARYARAIQAHRFSRGGDAQARIDGLIAAQPRNPYFWELKGQNLLENGQAGAAVPPLRKAVALAPGQPLLRLLLGHALMATNVPANVDQAIKELRVALQRDPEVLEAYQYLAQAYEKRGRTGDAELITAEGYAYAGAIEEAAFIAKRAQAKFPPNSPEWRKANDIIVQKKDKG
ncbi:MAG TPA: M48 family metalloprotease [Beijerinckiaceae bacterium]|nr:M48 family metalloprotease [Beijerinckiaceae bacterium]